MTVTKIEELDKKRNKIYIDGDFAFVLYKGEVRLYQIKEGMEIAEEIYMEITLQVLPKRAKLRCMNLLKVRACTEKQLRDKLRQGGYTTAIIDDAIDYVKSYGYVNDRQYTEDFIMYNMESKSRRRMESDLLKKGIDKYLISQIMEKIIEEEKGPDEITMAQNLLRKKNYNSDLATIKEKQKLAAFLYRKGFQTDTIRSALLLDITSN